MKLDPITEYILSEKIPDIKVDVSPPKLGLNIGPLPKFDECDEQCQKILASIYYPEGSKSSGGLKTLAVIAVVSAIVALSYLVYKRIMKTGYMKCRKLKGENKEICLKKFRDAARKSRIEQLKRYKKLCSKSKNPQKCAQKIDKKISSIAIKTSS